MITAKITAKQMQQEWKTLVARLKVRLLPTTARRLRRQGYWNFHSLSHFWNEWSAITSCAAKLGGSMENIIRFEIWLTTAPCDRALTPVAMMSPCAI